MLQVLTIRWVEFIVLPFIFHKIENIALETVRSHNLNNVI